MQIFTPKLHDLPHRIRKSVKKAFGVKIRKNFILPQKVPISDLAWDLVVNL